MSGGGRGSASDLHVLDDNLSATFLELGGNLDLEIGQLGRIEGIKESDDELLLSDPDGIAPVVVLGGLGLWCFVLLRDSC